MYRARRGDPAIERARPTSRRKVAYLVVLTLVSAGYFAWRVGFTVPVHQGIVSGVFGVALLVAELTAMIEAFIHLSNAVSSTMPERPTISASAYPHVDILIATHNEDTEILYKTVNGCLFLEYPDKKKVHIYICDDSDRPEMRRLAEELGVGYFGLSGNKHAKAGNLNNALAKTFSPLVATFDADMIPTRRYLMEVVPYFFLPTMIKDHGRWRRRNPRELANSKPVGFIQTPQSFYNADLFQFNLYAERNVPNEQDYFFREVNIGRNHTNSAIYAGSNTVIARAALQEVGGIRTGTITEDFATGIDIQAAGYVTYAIDAELAHGLAPSDFRSLIKQRQRWARGCVQVVRDPHFLTKKMAWGTKVSYFASFLYWWSFLRRFIYIMSPILFSVFGVLIVNCEAWQLIAIWLPFHILYNYVLNGINGKIWNTRWSNIAETVLFPYLIVPVLSEVFGVHLKKFAVTSKAALHEKNSEIRFAAPHLLMALFSVVGIVFCTRDLIEYGALGDLVILYWLVVNLYSLLLAIVCVSGRIDFDHEPRFRVQIPVTLQAAPAPIVATTDYLSATGFWVTLPDLVYLPNRQTFVAGLRSDHYHARLNVTTNKVESRDAGWRYELRIVDCAEEDRRQYFQMIFDRDHMFPTNIQSGFFGDVWSLIVGYVTRRVPVAPTATSVPSSAILRTVDGLEMELVRYSYEQLVVRDTPGLTNELLVNWSDTILLRCELATQGPQEGDDVECDVVYEIREVLSQADPDVGAEVADCLRPVRV